MPTSGGGGSPSSPAQEKKHQVRMAQPDLARVSAAGVSSTLTLPEPDNLSQMASLGNLGGGGLSGGLGGKGSGGGKGDGMGKGFGSGMAPGMSDGLGTKNPFGMQTALGHGALVGSFYDLKQAPDGKPTGMTDDEYREEIRNIVRSGLREAAFRKYFKAPRELYQTKLHIPAMSADSAPAAFEVDKQVQPKRWAVVYRGAIQAPKSGKFRFVGGGDDLLYVKFNGRPAFDYGFTLASTGTHMPGQVGSVDGTKDNPDLAKEIRRLSPMSVPINFYKYESTPFYNSMIGGFALGPEFTVQAGKSYPVEIMIGEIPGGFFSVSLMIEEIGATYQKDPTGSPILPLFRLDNDPPAKLEGEAPPISTDGPIWPFSSSGFRREL